MPEIKDITGQTFGRLTAIRRVGRNEHRQSMWLCQCECGNEVIVMSGHLKEGGHTTSCGCKNRDNHTTHGMSGTRTYRSWEAMIARCYNTEHEYYSDYGGRGVRVCEFLRAIPNNLLLLIGERADDRSIDRIDNDGHYSCGQCAECLQCGHPMNVRWATRKEQMNNTRMNVRLSRSGITKTVAQWSEELGIKAITLYQRVKRGVDPFAPVKTRNRKPKAEVPNP